MRTFIMETFAWSTRKRGKCMTLAPCCVRFRGLRQSQAISGSSPDVLGKPVVRALPGNDRVAVASSGSAATSLAGSGRRSCPFQVAVTCRHDGRIVPAARQACSCTGSRWLLCPPR